MSFILGGVPFRLSNGGDTDFWGVIFIIRISSSCLLTSSNFLSISQIFSLKLANFFLISSTLLSISTLVRLLISSVFSGVSSSRMESHVCEGKEAVVAVEQSLIPESLRSLHIRPLFFSSTSSVFVSSMETANLAAERLGRGLFAAELAAELRLLAAERLAIRPRALMALPVFC